MQYFYAIVDNDPDSAFGVRFPGLPGCFSAADRIEDVLPNACEALELWFNDAQETTPRRLDEIREMVSAELAEGAFVIAVPRIRRWASWCAQTSHSIAACSTRSIGQRRNAA